MSAMREPLHDSQVPAVTWRIRMTKTGPTKYMSHLDFIRTIERSARRAELPMTLSGGFNPRPRMSFSPALPVGVSSISEFVDIMLKEPVDMDEASERLNESFPAGMRIVSSRILPPNTPALSAIIQAASYRLDLHGETQVRLDCVLKAIDTLLSRDSIEVTRVTPKGVRRVDLRPLIYEMRVDAHSSLVSVHATCASGSEGNVRPFDLAEVILESEGIENDGVFMDITREGLYTFRFGRLCLPW
jgi:radical SAM-linked protein